MTAQEKIAHLESHLEIALARIEELESLLLGKGVKKTSKNSHLSPSSDLSRKNQSLREKSGKPVGGQQGHEGSTLEMRATPDVVIPLQPCFCQNCGNSLSSATFTLHSKRQVIDIPPILPTTTEYQSLSTVCSCGHKQVGSFPETVTSPIQYGPNIQSLVVYQSVYQYIPFARLQDFFKKICQVALSKGTIENILNRTAEKAQGMYETLRQTIAVSFFVGSDETGCKVNGKKHWFWVWQTAVVTFIVAACSRSKQVIADTFPEGLPDSILCSDRLAAQLSTVTKGTQICFAHLLRDLNYLIEAEQTTWAMDFKTLLKDALQLKKAQSAYTTSDAKVVEIEQRADALLDTISLLDDPVKHKQTLTFFRGMVKLRHALFPFLYDQRVAPDNNASERAIRNVKVKIKVSGQFKSLQQPYAIMRSIIDTAIKNGQSVAHAIQQMVNLPNKKQQAG